MKIDTDLVFATIESLVHEQATVAARTHRVIDVCAASYPHADWLVLSDLPYDAEVARLRSWIPDVLREVPPPFPIRGVWIGIANYAVDERVTADMHFIGSATYDADDEDQDWAVNAKYRPDHGLAESEILDSIYRIAYEGDAALGNDAEWSLCLAYGAFVIAEILRNETSAYVGGDSDVGVVVGFDEGDFITIGNVQVVRQ